MISAIVAVDNNFGIGYHNQLLFRIKEDMEVFKQLTLNNVVIMGRNTLESLPNGEPLKDRINIVLTSDKKKSEESTIEDNVIYANGMDAALLTASIYDKDVFIIGGQNVYNQMIDYCDRIYITKVDADCVADKYFPNIDENKFKLTEESEVKQYNSLLYKFCIYDRI